MIRAVDTISQITPQEASMLAKSGIGAFFGYIGGLNPYHLTQATVDAVHGAGMAIGLFAEFGTGAQFSAALGKQHAMDALNHARSLGIPAGVGIAPVIDCNIPIAQLDAVDAYLTAWMTEIDHVYPTGLYGPPQALQRFKEKVRYLIQPSAWSGGVKLPGIAMWQNSVSTQLCGINVDLDEVYDASILWFPKGVDTMSYPPVKVMFDGKRYPAVNINNNTYFIWTLARDAGCNLTKVQYNDVEIGGKKPRQWADGKNTYLCYADVPGIHPVRLANGSGWEFVKNAPPVNPVIANKQLIGMFEGDVLQDAFFFQPTTNGGTFGHFQLDTGAWELVLALRIANDLNLPNLGPAVQTYGAGTHKAHYSEIDIVIGDKVFPKQPCVVDEQWPAESVEFPSDGLFGLRFFIDNHLSLTLDPGTATLSVYSN